MDKCLFCEIIQGNIPSDKVYEDDLMIIIKDISPMAKNHFLLIPKSHYKTILEMTEQDSINLSKCLMKVRELKNELGLEGGFRLVMNQGDNAQQTVPHLHIHILSGQEMNWQPA